MHSNGSCKYFWHSSGVSKLFSLHFSGIVASIFSKEAIGLITGSITKVGSVAGCLIGSVEVGSIG